MKRILLPLLVISLAVIALSQGRGDVDAHALLVRADPPVNAQLREAPEVLTLYFSEPLERRFSSARVVNQQGDRVDERVEFDDTDPALMRVYLKDVAPGYLSVNWENVSSVDGHRISGAYPLTILNPDGSTPPGTPIEAGASVAGQDPDPFRVGAKFALLIAGCLLVGALAFVAYVTPGLCGDAATDAREAIERIALRLAVLAVAVLAVAGLVELVTQSADINASIGDVLDTRWGERWLLRNLVLIQPALLVGAMVLGYGSRRPVAWCALIGAVGYLAITSSVSHGAAGGGSFWAVTSDFVHLLATSIWLGMLALLIVLLVWARRNIASGARYPVIASGLQRFSIVAVFSVALLMFTGTLNTVIEVGQLGDLLNTGYGRALLAKLLLLIPLLGVAASNAYLVRPDLVEATENTGVRNRTTVLADLEGQLNHRMRIELGIAVVVIGVVALLVQLTPTRGRIDTPEGTSVLTAEGGGIQATLEVDPNQPGNNTFSVYLTGAVDVVESLRLEFVQPDGFSGQSRLELEPSNPPTFYVGQGPYLSSAGEWSIILNIRVIAPAGNDLRLSYSLDVPEVGGTPTSTPRSGGSFVSPVPLSATTIALLALSGATSVGIVVGSMSRPGLPEGYLGWLTAELAYRLAPFNVRPVYTLGALVIMGLVLGYVISNHLHQPLSPEEAAKDNPVPASAESIARGRMLFQNNCTICHGESGKGDGPAAGTLPIPPANLYDHIPYHPDTFFFNVITNGLSGIMPPFKDQLSEEDRWNILNYLRATFSATPALQ